MKILITGDAGFVGRNFVRYLSKHPKYSNATVVGCDIKNGKDCRELFKTSDERFDLVIHLAAIVGGRMTIEREPLAIATDLAIDADMFGWAVRTKQPRIMYFSSSAAYPESAQRHPNVLHESLIDVEDWRGDYVGKPDMIYGWSKVTGEYVANFVKQTGTKVYIARPFSGYGTDQDLSYPFPAFIQRAKEKQDPFMVWGSGAQVRDFIHIDDIVRISMKMVEEDYDKPLNLGWGIPVSFLQLAEFVTKEAGYTPKISTDGSKPMGVFYRCADSRRLFDFSAPRIPLNEGIRRALDGRL